MRFAVLMPSVRTTILSVLALASASAIPIAAHAEALTFYNTGVATDGSLLQAGEADSHYTLLYSSDAGGSIATATAANGAWTTASDAGWISPGADGNSNWASGYYVYETTVDLTGVDPSTVDLSGLLAADDQVYIYLNRGANAVFSSSGFTTLTPFSINSGFTQGLNQVDFVVVNGSGPTGLLVSDATAATPEPGSFYLLATGLMGSVGMMVRKRLS